MLRVTLGEIFVKVHAQECCEPCGNQRCKIAFLVATLRRGDDAPVAGGERVAEYLPDKGIHTHGEFPDHIGVAFDVGESPAIKRLFPKGDNAKSRVAVGNAHLIRGEVAASLGLLHIFPRGTALFGEKVFGTGRSKRCVEVGNIKRRHFDVFQHFVQRYRSLPDASFGEWKLEIGNWFVNHTITNNLLPFRRLSCTRCRRPRFRECRHRTAQVPRR